MKTIVKTVALALIGAGAIILVGCQPYYGPNGYYYTNGYYTNGYYSNACCPVRCTRVNCPSRCGYCPRQTDYYNSYLNGDVYYYD